MAPFQSVSPIVYSRAPLQGPFKSINRLASPGGHEDAEGRWPRQVDAYAFRGGRWGNKSSNHNNKPFNLYIYVDMAASILL